MANGQLGVQGPGAQLATSPPPALDTTKDRQYWAGPQLSNLGGTTPPSWARAQIWGVNGAFALTSANSLVKDKIQACPFWFNRAGTITHISTQVSTTVGNPAKFVFGLYGNIVDGNVWPGALIAQSSEISLDTAGSSLFITWSVGQQVAAGTLLWLAVTAGTNNVGFTFGGIDCGSMPGLVGTSAMYDASGVPSGSSAFCSAVRAAAPYSSTLPTPFPVTTPEVFATGAGGGLGTYPVFIYRFVKS